MAGEVKGAAGALVSVVVASHNGREVLRQSLAALFAQDYAPIEIIVVDNGSGGGVADLVMREFASARVVRLAENRGFAGGYNAGMREARGKYIALINDDAVAERGWASAMAEAAEADAQAGAVASVIIDGNREGRVDSCGLGIALDGMSRQAMRGAAAEGFEAPGEVLLPSGCACLYRAEALAEAGLFDEGFFAYCEDTDLGLRLRWAGWKTVTAARARVVHYYSMTTGKWSLRKVFWVERNHLWVAVKDFPLVLLAAAPFATAWRFLLQAYLLARGEAALTGFSRESGFLAVASAVAQAHLSAYMGLPRMIRKRMEFAARRKIGGMEMARAIWRFRMPMREILGGERNAGK